VLDAGLNISEANRGGLPVVVVAGEADVMTAPRLRQALDDIAERSRVVLVDMSQLSFIDSTALSVLIRARRRLTIRLVGLQPHVKKVFDVTGLSDSFAVYADRPTARSG